MHAHIGKEKWNQAAAFFIRMTVFVLEGGITLQDEFDKGDHDEAIYVVVYDDEKPIATGRHEQINADTIRPGRIATLKEYRKQGYGKLVLEKMEELGRELGCSISIIHGELSAVPFYERLGYKVVSDIYYEDGVPCKTLKKAL